jgi:hypothetical protein
MSALDELHLQCERRGWRLALTGQAYYPNGEPAPLSAYAMLLDGLEVRGRRDRFFGNRRELLARVRLNGLTRVDLARAAVDLARALESQGLIQ